MHAARLAPILVVASTAALLPSCRDATAVTVSVSTDIPCATVRTVETTIAAGTLLDFESRPATASTTRCDEATGTIGSLVFVPAGDDDAELAIRVVTALRNKLPEACSAASPEDCIVARRVLRYSPGHQLEVPIVMRGSCVGAANCEAVEPSDDAGAREIVVAETPAAPPAAAAAPSTPPPPEKGKEKPPKDPKDPKPKDDGEEDD